MTLRRPGMEEMSETAIRLAESYLARMDGGNSLQEMIGNPQGQGDEFGDLYKAFRKKVIEAYQD